MMLKRKGKFTTQPNRDYKGRIVVSIFDMDVWNWIVVQQSDFEIYPSYRQYNYELNQNLKAFPLVVAIDEKIYTLLSLKFGSNVSC